MDTNNDNEEKDRKELMIVSSLTLILLTLAAFYFEIYDKHDVPVFMRIVLSMYWIYSLVSLIASRIGSDRLVKRLYFNIGGIR